MLLVVMAT